MRAVTERKITRMCFINSSINLYRVLAPAFLQFDANIATVTPKNERCTQFVMTEKY